MSVMRGGVTENRDHYICLTCGYTFHLSVSRNDSEVRQAMQVQCPRCRGIRVEKKTKK